MTRKNIEKIGEALAYALTFDVSDKVEQVNIINDFLASLQRKGVIKAEELEEAAKFIDRRISEIALRTPVRKTGIDSYLGPQWETQERRESPQRTPQGHFSLP